MTLEERIRRIEQYIGTSEPEVWVRLRDEIRASLGAPRAVAEPAPTARPADLAYGDGRVSVWREIEAVLVGSDSDVTKPIPTRIRSLVAEVKRLHTERDEAREERDSLRAQLDECQRVFLQGEKVDTITKEKIARLERGVREAKVLLESVHMFFSSDDWKARFAWLKEFGS